MSRWPVGANVMWNNDTQKRADEANTMRRMKACVKVDVNMFTGTQLTTRLSVAENDLW
jgi:hypothetical protein